MFIFFLLTRRPPRFPPFPYPTLFRSIATPSASRSAPTSDPARCAGSPSAPPASPARPSSWRRRPPTPASPTTRSEEHTSELQSPCNIVCRLLLEKKKINGQQTRLVET